jgi:uncharacterized membrane protein YoaK (UPF0700 family)
MPGTTSGDAGQMNIRQAGGTRGTVQDRVLDRAAHAPPALLAVRDGLLVALSFAAGIYEAICFLSLGKVFTGFQTGNVVFLGLGVAGSRPPASANPVTAVISLAAFAAGAALAMPVLKAFDGDQEIADNDVVHVWPRCVSITLGIALAPQVGFLAGWLTTPRPAQLAFLLVALGAFAMGLQMNAIRALHVPSISTTAFTATVISLASGIATWSLPAPAVRRLAGSMVGTAAGAFFGDWMLRHAHPYAPAVPVVVVVVVVVVASVVLKPGGGSRPPRRYKASCRTALNTPNMTQKGRTRR